MKLFLTIIEAVLAVIVGFVICSIVLMVVIFGEREDTK